MKKTIQITIDEDCVQAVKQIAVQKKVDESLIYEDLVTTFCKMPIIVSCDLDDFCIKQIAKCDENDTHRKSSFTAERLSSYQRIQFFIEMVYNSQNELLKKAQKQGIE